MLLSSSDSSAAGGIFRSVRPCGHGLYHCILGLVRVETKLVD